MQEMQIELFEFRTDKDVEKPSMEIPASTDGEMIDSQIAVIFVLLEYRKCFTE